jgi:hypothetical protein
MGRTNLTLYRRCRKPTGELEAQIAYSEQRLKQLEEQSKRDDFDVEEYCRKSEEMIRTDLTTGKRRGYHRCGKGNSTGEQAMALQEVKQIQETTGG